VIGVDEQSTNLLTDENFQPSKSPAITACKATRPRVHAHSQRFSSRTVQRGSLAREHAVRPVHAEHDLRYRGPVAAVGAAALDALRCERSADLARRVEVARALVEVRR
jgi:hypothetical protein